MAFIGSLLNSNPLVDTATTDDERPTPDHVYRELISPSVCERLCKHILTKLAMPSAAVKVKSLLICKHLLEKGNPHFQKELQHNVNAIRACLEFRGPPDPVRGDAVYKAVRDKATALLNQIYEVKEPSSTPYDQQPTENKYQGMGSGSLNLGSQNISSSQYNNNQSQSNTTTLGGGGHTMHLGSGTNLKFMTNTNYQGSNPENKTETRNTGFGSGPVAEESKMAYVTGMAQNVLTQIGTSLNITKNEAPVVVDKGRYVAPSIGGGLRSPLQSSYPTSTINNNPASNQPTSLTQLAQERPLASGPMGGWEQVSRERAISSGMSNTLEYSIIDSFCNPGTSQQANPSRLQISQFLARIQKEDVRMEVIYYLLQEQLSNQDWKRKLRALYAIHELIVNNVQLAAHYFSDQGLASVLALTSSVQKTLQEKAIQIIQIISPQSLTQPTPEPVQEPIVNNNNQGVSSIFSSLSISDTAQQNEVTQQRKVSQSSSKYTPHHTPQPQQHFVKPPSQTLPQFQSQPPQTTLFGFPTTQTPTTTSNFQPVTQDNSLFINLQTQQQTQQTQQQQQQAQQNNNNNIFDEILFPNQKSLLGSQSLIGEPEPAPKTNDPNNIFFSSAVTSSPPHNNNNNNNNNNSNNNNASLFDLSFYAQPQLQSPITFPSNPNYSNLGYSSPSSSSGYTSNGRNANPAFSPSAPYSGPYSSNPKKYSTSSPSISNQKSADPFYFGDIKTLDLNL